MTGEDYPHTGGARNVEGGLPVRVQYSLTRKGRAFEHVARAIERRGRELISER